jgi:hypothetical protein
MSELTEQERSLNVIFATVSPVSQRAGLLFRNADDPVETAVAHTDTAQICLFSDQWLHVTYDKVRYHLTFYIFSVYKAECYGVSYGFYPGR